jgi:hypothetical protein
MLRFVLGLDVGGTGIQYGLFQVLPNGVLAPVNICPGDKRTQKGVAPHAKQVGSLIKKAMSTAQKYGGILVGVGVASPGRFKNGIIKKGSNPNMGRTTKEFDGVCLQEEYILACKKIGIDIIPIVVRNDADAMAIGLLNQLKESPEAFHDQNGNEVDIVNRVIGYLGLGTGLGNSFLKDYQFINDGHLSKIKISIDPADMTAFLQVRRKRRKEMQYFKPKRAKANLESLVCTPTLRVLAGLKQKKLLDVSHPEHQQAIALVGKYLARGIIAVHKGKIRDINPKNQWNDHEIEAAKCTSIYLLGGGVMSDGDVAKRLTQEIDATLQEDLGHQHGIQVVPMGCENPAVYAAANLLAIEDRLFE